MAQGVSPKILIVIPALNESANIARVVERIRKDLPSTDVLVINDGSSDATGQIARASGAHVLDMPHNVGIGAAMQTGFMFAERHGYTVILRSDGDGQHDAQDLQHLLETILSGDVDIVIGSRFLEDRGYQTPLNRRLGILILSRLISIINHETITDPTSGFNAFNHRAIRLFAEVYPHDYPEPEALVVAHRAGLRMREIPVTMRPREGGQSSITPLRSAYYMLKVILAILIGLLRRPALAEQS